MAKRRRALLGRVMVLLLGLVLVVAGGVAMASPPPSAAFDDDDGRTWLPRTDGDTTQLLLVNGISGDSLLELAEALRARGRSLVFITGELSAVDLTLVSRIATGFSPAYLVSVVAQRRGPFVAPPGVTGVACADAREFAARWAAMR